MTVLKREGGWVVDLDGQLFGESSDKEVTKAAANRRAREMHDSGRPCQVRVSGENGFHL
ncbi:MAG: hypothetical protein JWM33_1130 [Caulobacteraceae bacterium]|nr:hypothetical protein [Caulobacteraceae bacterium]